MWLYTIAAESAAEYGAKPSFPPFETWHFPSQLFWLTITFGGLYLVLSRVILPKLGGIIEKRGNTIASALDEAAKLNDQATEAQKALELRLAEARASARETANEARAKIESEIVAETRKVDEQIEAKLEAAEARIAETRAKALSNVTDIAAETARAMTGKFGVKASDDVLANAISKAMN